MLHGITARGTYNGVVGAYDGSARTDQNPHYHSISDTPEKIDWNYLTSVTKIVLATILTLDKKN